MEENIKTYYSRMNSSKDDKEKIIPFLKGKKNVLEVGCGSGVVSRLIAANFLHIIGGCEYFVAIDSSEDAVNATKDLLAMEVSDGLCNIERVDWWDFKSDIKFDAIVFSSVIHEIYSYTKYKGKLFSPLTIDKIIKKALSMLNNDGVIIIRDGVAPKDNFDVNIMFYDYDEYDLALRFFREMNGFRFYRAYANNIDREGSFYDIPLRYAAEMLYTITWGEESFPREIEQEYCYLTEDQWVDLLKLYNLNVIHHESYLQKGYEENFKKKYVLARKTINDVLIPIDYPDSNLLIVAHKPKKII